MNILRLLMMLLELILSDARKLWHLSHDSRGVIYDQNIFMIYAPRFVNYAPKTFKVQASLMMIIIYNCHIL